MNSSIKNSGTKKTIGCILILYNPDIDLIKAVTHSVVGQVDAVFIADNSAVSHHSLFELLGENAIYRKMTGNIGIAAAQNEGIQYFQKEGFTHLFFLDQDSILTPGLVQQLVKDLESLEKKNILVGGISARPYNRESEKKYQASVTKGKSYSDSLTEIGEIMNSASLISVNNFEKVGLFDESLFIDGVDHEWCWRAKSKKSLRFFISEKTKLSHFLGEGDRFFLFRKVAIPTPFRAYYQYRNYFILVRRDYVPTYWKFKNGIKYFIKLIYYPLFIKPRKEFRTAIFKGIKDGINAIRSL